jgi:hypothetical protein
MRLLAGPLQTRGFRLLLTGSTVSLVGDGIYSVAMAVAALRTVLPASSHASSSGCWVECLPTGSAAGCCC